MFNTEPMRGSSGSSSYTLAAVFPNARLGYSDLGSGYVRIRVEPTDGVTFSFPQGWKTPCGTSTRSNRYSTVVKASDRNAALAHATLIILGLNLQAAKIVPTYTSL